MIDPPRRSKPPNRADERPNKQQYLAGLKAKALKLSRPSLNHQVTNFALLTVGGLIFALAFNVFLVPADVAPGGLSGLILVIATWLPLPKGLMLLALNVPLLVLGAAQLGGLRFIARTLYVVAITTVAIDVTASFAVPAGVGIDPLLAAIYGGVVTGAAAGLVIRAQANIGGTGILSRVIQRRTGMPLGQVYLLTDGVIVMLMGLVFGWQLALYSLVALFVNGIATDHVLEGPSIIRTVFIITNHPELVAGAIELQLRTGVTAWQGRGMYSQADRTVLFCTINRTEVRELTRVVREVDETGFVVISQGHKALGGTIGKSDSAG